MYITNISLSKVCPVCAAVPGGDPNHVTDDFAGHLTLEHRSGPRDLISFLDEPSASRHGVRRIPHPSRAVGAPRARRYVAKLQIFVEQLIHSSTFNIM